MPECQDIDVIVERLVYSGKGMAIVRVRVVAETIR
jgi:hypothetical protein